MPQAFRGRRPAQGPPRKSGSSRFAEEVARAAKAGRGRDAAELFERGLDRIAREDYRGAVEALERAKQMAPRSPAVREALGMALYRLERYRDALRELSSYRRLSGRADQNHLLADAHRALGAPEKAVPLAEEALTSPIPDEAKAEAVVVAAAALGDLGRYPEALSLVRRWQVPETGVRPFDLRVWYVAGDVLARAGRPQEAEREFSRILRHDPDAFDVRERLAALSSPRPPRRAGSDSGRAPRRSSPRSTGSRNAPPDRSGRPEG
jgi:tetratricopeptide (TPR) repeat protein